MFFFLNVHLAAIKYGVPSFPLQTLLYRPLGPGMVGIGKELIRRSLLRNPVGVVNLLGKHEFSLELYMVIL